MVIIFRKTLIHSRRQNIENGPTIAAVKSGNSYETTEMRRLTVKDLIDRYIESELKKLRNHKTMLGQLKWFKEEIGHISLNHFREEVVAKCRDQLAKTPDKHGRPRSPATVNRYLCTLSSVVNIAIREWRLLTSSPFKNVRKLAEPRGRTRFLSKDDRVRLLKACKEAHAPIYIQSHYLPFLLECVEEKFSVFNGRILISIKGD